MEHYIKEALEIQQREGNISQRALEKYKDAIAAYNNNEENEYEFLYAHYQVMWIYSNQNQIEKALPHAKKCLDLLDIKIRTGSIIHFSDTGRFYQEAIRYAANVVGWHAYQSTNDANELEQALQTISLGCNYVDSPAYFYVFDTKVRLLLKIGHKDEAFRIVYNCLKEAPSFSDFEDIKRDKTYREWVDTFDSENKKIKYGAEGETIKEATQRYARAFNMGNDLFDFKPVCTLEQLQKEEEQLGFLYPQSVREFRMKVAGAFIEKHIRQRDNFLIEHEVSGVEMDFLCRGLASEIAEWCDMTEKNRDESTLKEWREEYFGDLETFDYLNTHFKVMGTYKSLAEHQYFFLIGSNQKLGIVVFQQDWWQSIFDLVEKDGLKTVVKYTDFEAMVSKFFTAVINIQLFEDEEWEQCSITEALDKEV